MKDYAKEYEKAIEFAKSKLPEGEEFKAMLFGVEEFDTVKKLLHRYFFGWLINMIFGQPRMYGIAYSDKTIVFVGFKQEMITVSYEPEIHFVKPISSVKIQKALMQYILSTEDDKGKKLKVAFSGQGEVKKDLEYLSGLVPA